MVLSSWFGVGLVPGAPGTAATLIAIPMALGLGKLGILQGLCFLLLFISIAYWACTRAWRLAREDDPSWIVIDEVIGLHLTLFGAALSSLDLLLGFIFFRIFDIWKPYPIRRTERLPGASGILADDILAGVYANLCIRIIHLLG